MMKEYRSTNGENGADSRFVIRAYFVIRHSSFGFRHFA